MNKSTLETPWTRLVGCHAPVQLAGMGGVAGPDLVLAVSQAGGLGMLGAPMIPPPVLDQILERLRHGTEKPFGVTFLMPILDLDCVDIASAKAKVVELFYGAPDAALVERARRGGALVSWQVGSVDEARAAEASGCDFVVAQGAEAGGHVRGVIGTLPLLASVLDAVAVPVVAAGGVGTARAMAACLAAGADAVRVGTRFLAAEEADIHPKYLAALIGARAEDTVLTEAFSVMWPNAPHRVLRSAVAAAEALDAEVAGEMAFAGGRMPIPRFSVPCPNRSASGHIEAMALYAGESVDAVRRIEPAAAIVAELVEGARKLLSQGW